MEHPQCGVDIEGDSLAVFEMVPSGGSLRGIYAVHQITGPSFSVPELLHATADGTVRRPKLAVNAAGNAFAVWEVEGSSSPYHVRGARYEKSTAVSRWVWNGELDKTGFDGHARSIAVGIDREDRALVVWARQDALTSTVWALRIGPDDVDPPAPGELSAGLSGRAEQPHLAVHEDGRAFVVWAQHVDATDHAIIARAYTPASGWTAAATIWSGTVRPENPYVAVGPAGDAIVVWNDYDVHASHYLGGTSWSPRVTLSRWFSVEDATRPRVAIDMDGRAVAVWQQQVYDPPRSTVRVAMYE
jgi:hypothetical protein